MLRFGKVFLGLMIGATLVPAPASLPAQAPAAAPAAAKPPIKWLTLGQAAKAKAKTDVYLTGTVLSMAAPKGESKAPYIIYLSDESGTGKLVIFQDIWATIPDTTIFEKGNVLQVFGQADDYRGERQVEVRKANHVRRAPGTSAPSPEAAAAIAAPAGALKIGSLSLAHIGQQVIVTAKVAKVDVPNGERVPYRITLEDETGEVVMVYWKDVAKALAPEDKPKVDRVLRVTAEVAEHKGKLQLRVEDPELIKADASNSGS